MEYSWNLNDKISVINNDNSDSTKPLIIFIHGGPGLSHHYFIPLMKSLSPFATCIGYDQGSQFSKVENEWTVSALVEELNAVIDLYNYKESKSVFLFAHSFGSVVALEYVRRFNKISGLMLCSWIYDENWLNLFCERNPDYINIEEKINHQNKFISDLKEKIINKTVAYQDYYFPSYNSLLGKKIFNNLNYYPKITEALEDSWMKQVNTVEALKQINLPMLSLSGVEDRVVFSDYTASSLIYNKNIHHIDVPGGHFPFLDDLNTVVSTVLNFIHKPIFSKGAFNEKA